MKSKNGEKQKPSEEIFVSVLGDEKILRFNYQRKFPESHGILFGRRKPWQSDYALAFAAHGHLLDHPSWRWVQNEKPIFQSHREGVALASLYKIPPLTLDEPLRLELRAGHRMTGRPFDEGKKKLLRLEQGVDEAGFVSFFEGIRFSPMQVRLELTLKLRDAGNAEETLPLLKVTLGKCEKKFGALDLKSNVFSMDCKLQRASKVAPQVYWLGRGKLDLHKIVLSRVQGIP